MGSAYGTTYPETNVGAPYPNSFNAWIVLVDTMKTAERRLPITAHEVFHTIQVEYDRYESTSLLEMYSVWAQERCYDFSTVHYPTTRLFLPSAVPRVVPADVQQRALGLLSHPEIRRRHHEEHASAVRRYTRTQSTRGLRRALSGYGTNFLNAFVDFGTFNYWVGARDDGMHYQEGKNYYTTMVERRTLCYPETLYVSTHPPAELGTNYALLDGDGHSGPLTVYIYPEYLASTILTMTKFKGGVQTRTTKFYPQFSAAVDAVPIPDWAQVDSLLLVYQVNESAAADNSLGLEAYGAPGASPAPPWVLVLDCDGCRLPFDALQDDYQVRDGEEQPIADALRHLGATVRVEDTLPADLGGCRGIFLVGGFDSHGVDIKDADLQRLNTFMDNGGDIYVEGSRLGEYMDPSLGAGNATQQSFWTRFSCTFTPGLSFGNLLQWDTSGNPFIAAHSFSYDNTGDANTYNGILTPTGNAAYLVRDGAAKIRATAVRAAGGSSTRIMSTMLVGASTGLSGNTREAFLNDVLTMFDTNLAALAVLRANVSVELRHVSIAGVLEHYDGETLALYRTDALARHEVALELARTGGEWHFHAKDELATSSALYQLVDVNNERTLWQQKVNERTPSYTLRLTGIYPNPARDNVRIALDSPADAGATLSVYDVAGREVSRENASLKRGSNVLFLRSLPPASGVYFVHIAAPGGEARGRLLVIR
jgi:hypothetical protein